MNPQGKIRESLIAGTWYPGNPEVLRRDIESYLSAAQPVPIQGELIGLVSPHAGYQYSGAVAAHAYKLLRSQPFNRVVIVAPSHRAYFRGSSIYKPGGYRTPLGVVPLDRELIDELCTQPAALDYVPRAHSQEHSLEIQLPFLQVVLNEFELTPIIMGDQDLENCRQLASALATVCRGRKVLLLASSDLSHFHSYEEATRLDRVILERWSACDPEGLYADLQAGRCESCGGGPMITVMLAAKALGADKASVLRYANSGDVTGDKSGVVGYLAAALHANPGPREGLRHAGGGKVGVDLGLSAEAKEALRALALQAIRSRCMGLPIPDAPLQEAQLLEKRGAFVCLHLEGRLRGCIGTIEPRDPLHETIRNMAIQAAFADPRFSPLEACELDRIQLEISVLTPLERINDPDQIQVGLHGLYLRKGHHSGLLLPQVATEHGWDRKTFLEWTCKKAGLAPDAWKNPDVEISLFSADIF